MSASPAFSVRLLLVIPVNTGIAPPPNIFTAVNPRGLFVLAIRHPPYSQTQAVNDRFHLSP